MKQGIRRYNLIHTPEPREQSGSERARERAFRHATADSDTRPTRHWTERGQSLAEAQGRSSRSGQRRGRTHVTMVTVHGISMGPHADRCRPYTRLTHVSSATEHDAHPHVARARCTLCSFCRLHEHVETPCDFSNQPCIPLTQMSGDTAHSQLDARPMRRLHPGEFTIIQAFNLPYLRLWLKL